MDFIERTHGLYLWRSSVPLFTGTEKECKFYRDILLTEAERFHGYSILPLPYHPPQRVANRVWAFIGAAVMGLFIIILTLAVRGGR
jgi:hypothetical protein